MCAARRHCRLARTSPRLEHHCTTTPCRLFSARLARADYELLAYCGRALAGRAVLLANPDIVFDPTDLWAVRAGRLGNRSAYVFSVRRGERALLHAASGANASEVERCRAAQVDRCTEWCPPKVWPTSWDAYLFRPRGDARPLPAGAAAAAGTADAAPRADAALHFPMNVINAENFALRAMRDRLGLSHVHNGCDQLRAYDLHCAPKTWRADESGPAGPAGWRSLVHYRDGAAGRSPQLERWPTAREKWAELARRWVALRAEAPPKCGAGGAAAPGARCRALAGGGRGGAVNGTAVAEGVCERRRGQ